MQSTEYACAVTICQIQCRKLIINGASMTDEDVLLDCWKNHFSNLVQTQTSETNDSDIINDMDAPSHENEDFILDHKFTADKIEHALRHEI